MSTGSTHITPNKVNIISEGGIDNVYSPCSNFDLRPVDEMTLGFTGIAGFLFWDGRGKNADSINNLYLSLWKNTFRALNHMNGDDVIGTLSQGGGYWGHKEQQRYLKKKFYKDNFDASDAVAKAADAPIEMQALVSNNKEMVVGYVRNRTYNTYTMRTNNSSKCYTNKGAFPYDTKINLRWDYKYVKDGENNNGAFVKRIKVEGLPNLKKYSIDFYTLDGYNSSAVKKTSSGKLRIEFPELYFIESWQKRPVIWFVAKRLNTSNKPALNSTENELEILFMQQRKSLELDTTIIEQEDNLISIYPNPFENTLTIISPEDDVVNVQTTMGNTLKKYNIRAGENKIELVGLAHGIYFLYFEDQGINFKIIKL
ncbi:MAG: T9SS type A sorting domain-containing protein [Brumimicrobium sp.]|nr:T9SS type A sorting domain-containing protein [Brumimicrobium sp.]